MNILITGKSETGKSNMVDIIKNTIFKMDNDCTITINDPNKKHNHFGSGKNIHNIEVKRMEDNYADLNEYDVRIVINNGNFKNWYDKI